MLLTGLDWKYFNWHQMEFHGMLNLMKTGLAFADSINTVSPRYAEEIQTSPLGCGLEGMLQHRRDALSGILNGMDETHWDPATDPHIAANYTVDSVGRGKPLCKAALQDELGLPQKPDTPLIGLIGRLADQKGFDLVAEVIQQWVQAVDAQWVILGTGEPKYHELFETLTERFPQKVSAKLEFSDPLAHQIEAGADIFLMPSRYEPCGLNQLYSLKYGTVPVVRSTGGLADTINDQNGFSFHEYSPLALSEVLRRACQAYHDKATWNHLINIGMQQDWSWAHSAKEYVDLYHTTLARTGQVVSG
jgi:starch synthase